MRICSITIKNFRCYYGESSVSFNNNGKVTLIYARSGFGKSSFLQFFRWMFYNDPDFGKGNDKPLFNIPAYLEKKAGEILEVKGIVEFEHLGVKYSLEKICEYVVSEQNQPIKINNNEVSLQYLENNNWCIYNGDVAKKINSIMPKGLSKYFLLDGERAREIVLNSSDLKTAIYSLFGIDVYDRALEHLGTTYKKKSVIGYYNNLMTSQIKDTGAVKIGMSPAEYRVTLENLNEEIENDEKRKRDISSQITACKAKRDIILQSLGEVQNKGNIEEIIKRNNEDIERYEGEIIKEKSNIGNLFYKNYPYILMTGMASKSSKILREKKESFSVNYKSVFNCLKKDLLNEIIEKNICVCGRELDANSIKHINDTIAIMPPDSYAFQFAQFVKKAKAEIEKAEFSMYGYETVKSKITDYQLKIARKEEDNVDRYNELRRLDESKELIEKLEELDKEIRSNTSIRDSISGEIAKKRQTFNIASAQLKKIIAMSAASQKYGGIIGMFKDIHAELSLEKEMKEHDVAVLLNNCVRDVFKKLTTQDIKDVDKTVFVKPDFTSRSTFLAGGQLAVDVYSYVIGIVNALQKMNMDSNENPIIIDAPFAFTDDIQSCHILETLPSIVKQSILLTLDLDKVSELLKDNSKYEFYVINNPTMTKAKIERGDINAIKF